MKKYHMTKTAMPGDMIFRQKPENEFQVLINWGKKVQVTKKKLRGLRKFSFTKDKEKIFLST